MPLIKQVKLSLLVAALCGQVASLEGCSSSRVAVEPSPVAVEPSGRPEPPGGTDNLLDPRATQYPVFDAERLSLTSVYSREHYGRLSFKLADPQMIVVHYTAIATLRDTLEFFKPSRLDRRSRKDIAGGGEVNVSAHYVVDSNGEIYQLAPEDVICRHTIGFNHTAIGIENVAADADHLSDRQARATAGLISRIIGRHPTIRYLIGHHEYRDRALPHYRLLIENDAAYRFTEKIDPGPRFMARVRQLLQKDYGITLSD